MAQLQTFIGLWVGVCWKGVYDWLKENPEAKQEEFIEAMEERQEELISISGSEDDDRN